MYQFIHYTYLYLYIDIYLSIKLTIIKFKNNLIVRSWFVIPYLKELLIILSIYSATIFN